MQKVKLVIGLGNPGKKYENTYHNIGVLFVKYLINKTSPSSNFPARPRLLADRQFIISNTFMNESGSFVTKALKKSGIKPAELMIVHDDSDIELGKYKISFGRGSAGHKGVESIIRSLKTKNFWRLRIGARTSSRTNQFQASRKKAADFVLKKITKNDWEVLKKIFSEIELV